MGGTGSSRWTTTITRVLADGLVRLDVRVLARKGALRPGARSNVTWGTGTAITVEVPEDDDEVMCLAYGVQMRGRAGATVAEHVRLMRTPCTFGAFRVWFACPGCGRRCAVLYALAGRFTCRSCHHLAYASTRQRRGRRHGVAHPGCRNND